MLAPSARLPTMHLVIMVARTVIVCSIFISRAARKRSVEASGTQSINQGTS